jgi:hypothetical protein
VFRQSPKIITFLLTLSLVVGFYAQAFQGLVGLEKLSPDVLSPLAEKTAPLTRLERSIKADLVRMKLLNAKKFYSELSNDDSNPKLYQSYLREVSETLGNISEGDKKKLKGMTNEDIYIKFLKGTKIDKAKKLAKYQILKIIEDNWDCTKSSRSSPYRFRNCPNLKDTVFNDLSVEDLKTAKMIATDKLNESLVYTTSMKQAYHFEWDFGHVDIDKKTLKTLRVILEVAANNDANHPDPVADDLKADNDVRSKSKAGGSSDSENLEGLGSNDY